MHSRPLREACLSGSATSAARRSAHSRVSSKYPRAQAGDRDAMQITGLHRRRGFIQSVRVPLVAADKR